MKPFWKILFSRLERLAKLWEKVNKRKQEDRLVKPANNWSYFEGLTKKNATFLATIEPDRTQQDLG